MFITFQLTNITTFIAHHQSELQPVESTQGVRVFCLPRISVFFPELSVFFPKQTFAKQVEILMLLDHFAGGPRAKSRRGTSDYCLNNLSNDNNYPPNNHNDSHIYRSLAGLGSEYYCTDNISSPPSIKHRPYHPNLCTFDHFVIDKSTTATESLEASVWDEHLSKPQHQS